MRRRPDEQACRRVGLQQVITALDLLEADPARPERYRPRGYDGSYWISLDLANDQWNGFKHSEGGGPLDLVIACKNAPSYRIANSLFYEALCDVAEALDLWSEDLEVRSERLAKAHDSSKARDKFAWMERVIDAIQTGEAGEAWQEARELLEALGLDPELVTLCGYQGALCWQPHVPWQGVRVSTATNDKGRTYFGGWTKARAEEWMTRADGLRLLTFDLDGTKKTERRPEVYPKSSHVMALVNELGRRGLPASAVVWSSIIDEQHAKAHLYFVMRDSALDEQDWKRCWGEVAAEIEDAAATLELSIDERRALELDPCTCQITRMVRLPGFSKYGRDRAGVIVRAKYRPIDLAEWLETKEQVTQVGSKREQRWGHGLCYTQSLEGDEKTTALARSVFPIAPFRLHDGSDHGVLFRYHVPGTRTPHYARISASAFTDGSGARKAAATAAAQGVQVATNRGQEFALALGTWRDVCRRPTIQLLDASGWHRRDDGGWMYANGSELHGGRGVRMDPTSTTAKTRSTRRGDLSEWRERAHDLLTTPGLVFAVGTSLAGPLLSRLDRGSFMVNLCGNSSAGKTTALRLAASLWGDTRDILRSWDSTRNALEGLAAASNDSVLVLDELQRFLSSGATGAELSRAVHTIAGTTGRARMTRTAQMRAVRQWRCASLSTSEAPLRDLVGSSFRGGDGVRAVDLEVKMGELTVDAAHAHDLDELARTHAGVVANSFVAWLSRQADNVLEDRFNSHRRELEGFAKSSEAGRVMGHIALVATALELATWARVLPEGVPLAESIGWARDLVLAARLGMDTPEERALTLLHNAVLEHPASFPRESAVTNARECWGILREGGSVTNPQGQELWVTEGMLKGGVLKGHSVRPWIRWCREQSVARSEPLVRVAKKQARWVVFDLDAIAERLKTQEAREQV